MAISNLYSRKTMRNRRRFMMDRLDYGQKAEKTIDGELVSSYMCLPESAAEEEASINLWCPPMWTRPIYENGFSEILSSVPQTGWWKS